MSASESNRNLLFGILALQMDFINREQLVAATSKWLMDKTRPIEEILVDQRALSREDQELLAPLVQRHIQNHDGNPEKSLAAISSLGSVQQDLRSLGDTDIEASLANLSATWTDHLQSDATLAVKSPTTGHSGDATLAPGTSTGGLRFRILRPHAKGGLGAVSVAQDLEVGREVALKEIQPQFADHMDSRARFLLEAEVTGSLEHPGIVPVYGLGHYSDGRPYYAMRFIRGDSLKEGVDRFHSTDNETHDPGERELQLRKLLGRFIDVCDAIEYAHSRGVLHRDLKPGNIMLGKYGETLVVDWGLAKTLGKSDRTKSDGEATLRPSSMSSSTDTQMGAAIGTPAYMSPEQAAGRLDELGPAADVYSLGATLYYLLAGQPPITDKDVGSVLRRVQAGDFPRPREIKKHIPAPLEAICLKSMATAPSERYASVRELAADLESWLADEPVAAFHEPWSVRARRWLKRHRTVVTAGSAAAAVALLTLTTATVFLAAANNRERAAKSREVLAKQDALDNASEAEAQRKIAQEKSDEAEAERDKAQRQTEAKQIALEEARRTLYFSRIATASRELAAFNRASAEEALDLCPPDLRHWEWHYLKRRCHSELARFNISSPASGGRILAVSPNGEWLAAATNEYEDGEETVSQTGVVQILDARTGATRQSISAHDEGINSIAISPSGNLVASAGGDATVKLWNATTGEQVHSLAGHEQAVRAVTFSHDGTAVASAGYDNRVVLWNSETGERLSSYDNLDSAPTCLAFDRDGRSLVICDAEGEFFVVNLSTGRRSAKLAGTTFGIQDVSTSADGRFLAICSGSLSHGDIRIINAATGGQLFSINTSLKTLRTIDFSQDADKLAASGDDGVVRIFDALTGEELQSLAGHASAVHSVAFSPIGDVLYSIGEDGSLRTWDATTSAYVRRPPDAFVKRPFVSFAETMTATSQDGSKFAIVQSTSDAYGDGPLKFSAEVYTTTTWRTLALIEDLHDVRDVVFSSDDGILAVTDGKRLLAFDITTSKPVTGDFDVATLPSDFGRIVDVRPDDRIVIHNPLNGTEPIELEGVTPNWNAGKLSPNGARYVATTGSSESGAGDTKLWNAKTGVLIVSRPSQAAYIDDYLIAFSPDGNLLALLGDDAVEIWDANDGRQLHSLSAKAMNHRHLLFSPDGKTLAAATGELFQTKQFGRVILWDVETGERVATLVGHTDMIERIAFSADGRRLATGGADETVRIWDLASGMETLALPSPWEYLNDLWFSSDGGFLVGIAEGHVKAWPAAATHAHDLVTFRGHLATVNAMAYSNDGQMVATVDRENDVKVWNPTTGEIIHRLAGPSFAVQSLAFRPDSQQLAAGCGEYVGDTSYQGELFVWDLSSGQRIESLSREGGIVPSVAYNADGSLLAYAIGGQPDRARGTVVEPGSVVVLDTLTGNEVTRFEQHTGILNAVDFHPVENLVASCGGDPESGELLLWDVASNEIRQTIITDDGMIFCLDFAPDGESIVGGSTANPIRVWNVADGSQKTSFAGHDGACSSVHFDPHGSTVISLGADSRLRIWDTRTQQEIASLDLRVGDTTGTLLSPDGARLVTGSEGGAVKVWDVAMLRNASWSADARMTEAQRQVWHRQECRHAERWDGWHTFAFHLAQLIQHEPDNVDYRLRHAAALNKLERDEDAAAELQQTLQRAPDMISVQQRAGALYLDLGRHEEALACFERAIELGSTDGAAYRGRADVHRMQGEFEKAIEDYTASMQVEADNSEAYLDRATCYRSLDDHAKAIEDLTKCIELNPRYAVAYNNRGYSYEMTGQLQKALSDYTAAIAQDLAFATALENRASLHRDLGMLKEAEADYSAALKVNPESVSSLLGRGDILSDSEEFQRALVDYSQVIELAPETPRVHRKRADAYRALGVFDKALVDYNHALKMNPQDTLALNNRGATYNRMGQHVKAIADYNTAIGLEPDAAVLYRNRGDAFQSAGNNQLAVEDFTDSLKFEPDNLYALRQRGLSYLRLGQLDEAIADCDAVLEQHPDEVLTLNNRGYSYAAKGELETAINDYTAAIGHQPDFALGYQNRGAAYLQLQKWDEAIQDFAKNASLAEDDVNAWGFLALAVRRSGDLKRYRETCRTMLAKFGGTTDATTADVLIRMCSLGPSAVDELALLAQLAANVVASDSTDFSYKTSLGAMLYRNDKFDASIGQIQNAIKQQGRGGTHTDWLFLAMSHARQGQIEEAQKWAAKSRDYAAQLESGASPPLLWSQRVQFDILLAEAEELLKSSATD